MADVGCHQPVGATNTLILNGGRATHRCLFVECSRSQKAQTSFQLVRAEALPARWAAPLTRQHRVHRCSFDMRTGGIPRRNALLSSFRPNAEQKERSNGKTQLRICETAERSRQKAEEGRETTAEDRHERTPTSGGSTPAARRCQDDAGWFVGAQEPNAGRCTKLRAAEAAELQTKRAKASTKRTGSKKAQRKRPAKKR